MNAYILLKRIIALPFFAFFFVIDYFIYLYHKVFKKPYGSIRDIRTFYVEVWLHL